MHNRKTFAYLHYKNNTKTKPMQKERQEKTKKLKRAGKILTLQELCLERMNFYINEQSKTEVCSDEYYKLDSLIQHWHYRNRKLYELLKKELQK